MELWIFKALILRLIWFNCSWVRVTLGPPWQSADERADFEERTWTLLLWFWGFLLLLLLYFSLLYFVERERCNPCMDYQVCCLTQSTYYRGKALLLPWISVTPCFQRLFTQPLFHLPWLHPCEVEREELEHKRSLRSGLLGVEPWWQSRKTHKCRLSPHSS